MRILVLQHLDVEHPGTLRDFWAAEGHEWRTVELDAGEPIPALEGFDLMAVMGGPMDVWQHDQFPWLKPEMEAIRHWVKDLGRPYLGICLGHQLLAEALGGKVGLMKLPEVGLAEVEVTPAGRDDRLFDGFGRTIETLQWHGAEVQRLPEGAVILASNTACSVQAFRWGRHAYGFQCHVEITDTTVGDWERIPEYKASLEKALGAEGAAALKQNIGERLSSFRLTAERLHRNFVAAAF